MKLKDFIRNYREEHDLSQRRFAEICGVSNGYIAMLEKDENPGTKKPIVPSLTMLRKIAEGCGITLEALLSSVDDMQVSLSQTPFDFDNIIPITTHKIPLLGSIACGEPIFAQEDFERYVDVGSGVRADFALKARGDSMINARICDGDIVFIRRQETVENGQIAAVIIEDEATLKRVYFGSDTLMLVAENPAYAPIVINKNEHKSVHILGRAVAFQSDIK